MNRQRQAEKYFTLICGEEEKEEKWMLNAKIIPFSDYLSHFDEEPQVGQENNLFTFPIPLTYVDSQIIELTNLFYEMHKYNKESIKISKVQAMSNADKYKRTKALNRQYKSIVYPAAFKG